MHATVARARLPIDGFGFGALLGDEGEEKVHETVARARFHIKIVKKTVTFGALLEHEVGKRCTRL